ncbi:MAG: ATP-grasp domain-containing protein [Lachnospiraceae bacterium]|nr:ATP-grasp domain-containing protein [Lachnospiraceae bacterium]
MKDKEINVLILSAGRRVELIRCFKSARDRLKIKGSVVAGDASDLAPALYFADDPVIFPRIDSGRYTEAIIETCLEKNISLIVPTIDTELLLLAKNKDRIEAETGSRVLISDLSVITVCRNKINTQHFMEENGFKVPRMYTEDEIREKKERYPLFVKPIDGSSSIDTYKVENREKLEAVLSLVKDPMIQDYMEGEEYTIDVFLNFSSEIITLVPRIRIATRSGEIAKGKIVKDDEIISDVKRLMDILRPVGHITVQCRKTDRGVEYIEINPRFGGGAPMSIMAGADSCENLYRLLLGEELKYNEDYETNVTFLRYDSSVMLDEKKRLVNEKSDLV